MRGSPAGHGWLAGMGTKGRCRASGGARKYVSPTVLEAVQRLDADRCVGDRDALDGLRLFDDAAGPRTV